MSKKDPKKPISLIRFANLELPQALKSQAKRVIAKVFYTSLAWKKYFSAKLRGLESQQYFFSAEIAKKAKNSAFSKIIFQPNWNLNIALRFHHKWIAGTRTRGFCAGTTQIRDNIREIGSSEKCDFHRFAKMLKFFFSSFN